MPVANIVRIMMQLTEANMTSTPTSSGSHNRRTRSIIGIVCPSVCLSDWDKRNTLVIRSCVLTPYDERYET